MLKIKQHRYRTKERPVLVSGRVPRGEHLQLQNAGITPSVAVKFGVAYAGIDPEGVRVFMEAVHHKRALLEWTRSPRSSPPPVFRPDNDKIENVIFLQVVISEV